MINISIFRDKQGIIKRLKIEGHAGYGQRGNDIVCAAVSVTAYNAVGALEELAGIKNCHYEKDGYMEINIPSDIGEECKKTARIILETTVVGFKQIEMEYKNYVLVLDKEV